MPLEDDVSNARKKVFRDGYDMSFGELSSLYEKGELVIFPEYQRLFRWDDTQKTRFIESLLLNIPIPPIFVFSDKSGRWELVDGLQRVSTVLEFMGVLRNPEGELLPKFTCDGTSLLPALEDVRWPNEGEEESAPNILPQALQAGLRRSRIRVEILGQETDANVKYELFQRLNTGGAILSEQEIRNVIVIAINREVFENVIHMSQDATFVGLTPVGDERVNRQYRVELVTRFVVLRHFEYRRGMDVHYYLDQGMISVSSKTDFDWNHERDIFKLTMEKLSSATGDASFKRNNRFSLALYEFISLGLSKALEAAGNAITDEFIQHRIAAIQDLPEAQQYSGPGVRGTQRLSGLVMPLAQPHFAPPEHEEN